MSVMLLDWPVPAGIVAGFTTRSGGISQPPYDGQNMALHVGDDEQAVQQNRQFLDSLLPGSHKRWQWLNQVHGVAVADADDNGQVLTADACYSRQSSRVCNVLTADCLPLLLCDRQGAEVAAVHAGWRSLCDGVIENTLARFTAPANQIQAWLGPAIGPLAFEVGEDVRSAFARQTQGERAMQAFAATDRPGKYLCDIYQLARIRLQACGVGSLYGGGYCTVGNPASFYSYRRDGVTGRMLSFIYRL